MKYWKASKGSVVRFCYLIHGSIGVFLTVYLTQNSLYWFIAAVFLLFMTELVLTTRYNKTGEWRWFTPLVLIYLAFVVPTVWVLEYTMLQLRIDVMNRTQSAECPINLESVPAILPCVSDINETSSSVYEEEFIVNKEEVEIYYTKLRVSTTYQQSLMLTLILGRWLLPKGGLTQDELSQILLVYIGIAADMLEFSSETITLEGVACEKGIFTAILCIWSWSTLQFTLTLTSKKRKRRIQVIKLTFTDRNTKWMSGLNEFAVYFLHAEIWALMSDFILQDAPYLLIRIYILITYNVINQSMVFFTCKNALLIFLQCYRLHVVIVESRKHRAQSLEAERSKERDKAAAHGYASVLINSNRDNDRSTDTSDTSNSDRVESHIVGIENVSFESPDNHEDGEMAIYSLPTADNMSGGDVNANDHDTNSSAASMNSVHQIDVEIHSQYF